MAPSPPVNAPRLAFHVLAVLLYGEHDWLTRSDPWTVTASTGKLCTSVGTRPENLRLALMNLADRGLLTFTWHRHYFVARVTPPRWSTP